MFRKFHENFNSIFLKRKKFYDFTGILYRQKKYCRRVIASFSVFATIWSQPAAPGLTTHGLYYLPLYVEEHCLKWASFEELIVCRHKSLGRIRPENYINPDAGKI